MSAFNELHECKLGCPRCGKPFVGTVSLGFGIRQGDRYRVGDRQTFRPQAPAEDGGRPDGDVIAGHGWAECPHCTLTFYARVVLRGDVILGAEPDLGFLPPCTDGCFDLEPCPWCGRSGTATLSCVINYQIGVIYCAADGVFCRVDGHQVLLSRPFVGGERPVIIGEPLPWVWSTFHSYS